MSVQSDRAATGSAPVGARPQRIDVLIFSSDDELLIELGPALGNHFRSRQIEQIEDLEAAAQGRRAIAVLDTASSVDARRVYAELNARPDTIPVIVISGAEQRASWVAALERGAIAALLTRDMQLPEQFAAALATASKVFDAPRAVAAGATPPVTQPARAKWPILVAALVVIGVVITWLATRDHAVPSAAQSGGAQSGSAAASTAQPVAAPDAQDAGPASVPQLLSAARVAFGDQRYLEPAGNNALDLFQQVLKQDPENAEAREGVLRLFDIIRARSDAALKAGRIDEADNLLSAVRLVAPDSDLARDLGRSVTTERPRWLASQVRASLAAGNLAQAQKFFDELNDIATDKRGLQDLQRAIDARQRDLQMDGAFAAVHAAIVAGNLTEPAAGNAHALWVAIAAADRKTPAAIAVQKEYQLALIAAGREQMRDQHFESAERYLGVAAELGGGAELADARKSLGVAQEAAEKLNAAARANIGAEGAGPDTAAASAANAPQYVRATVKRSVEPAYPAAARARQQEGFVDVHFNLAPDGKPFNLGVLQSSPPGVFDAAALEAVRRWVFQPVPVAAGAPAPLARLRVTFRLKG